MSDLPSGASSSLQPRLRDDLLTTLRFALDEARRTISVDHPVRVQVESAMADIDFYRTMVAAPDPLGEAKLQQTEPNEGVADLAELWRLKVYPHIEREVFMTHLADKTAVGWDDVRIEVTALREIVAPAPAGPSRLRALLTEWREHAKDERSSLLSSQRRMLEICADELEALVGPAPVCEPQPQETKDLDPRVEAGATIPPTGSTAQSSAGDK
jgi:hypothetical protein